MNLKEGLTPGSLAGPGVPRGHKQMIRRPSRGKYLSREHSPDQHEVNKPDPETQARLVENFKAHFRLVKERLKQFSSAEQQAAEDHSLSAIGLRLPDKSYSRCDGNDIEDHLNKVFLRAGLKPLSVEGSQSHKHSLQSNKENLLPEGEHNMESLFSFRGNSKPATRPVLAQKAAQSFNPFDSKRARAGHKPTERSVRRSPNMSIVNDSLTEKSTAKSELNVLPVAHPKSENPVIAKQPSEKEVSKFRSNSTVNNPRVQSRSKSALAIGERRKISQKEMVERSKRNFNELPDVKANARERSKRECLIERNRRRKDYGYGRQHLTRRSAAA